MEIKKNSNVSARFPDLLLFLLHVMLSKDFYEKLIPIKYIIS